MLAHPTGGTVALATRANNQEETKVRNTIIAALSAALLVAVLAPFEAAAGEAASERAAALLEAMELPANAHALRQTGTSPAEVRAALEVLRKARAADDQERASRRSARLLRLEVEMAREHGHMEGFGAFVRAQVEAGVRGQELAAAIREHRGEQRRGRAQAREEAKQRKAAPQKADRTPERTGVGKRTQERRQIGTPVRPAAGERRPVGRQPARTDDDDDESETRSRRGPARR